MSRMREEAMEAAEAVARFLDRNGPMLADLGARLRADPPAVILTAARGSSDHAATYLKYLAEIRLGLPVASLGASVVSIYGAGLRARGALCVTISQSGRSPDLVALQAAAKAGGAVTLALVNVEESPVATAADRLLPLAAGPELSVAATKSFVVSLVAAASLVAHWHGEPGFLAAVAALPERLAAAASIDWPDLVEAGLAGGSLYVLGRGPSLAVAAETALKLKETCAIHAEAYSLAEVLHGPVELVRPGFPVLAFVPADEARPAGLETLARMEAAGARIMAAGPGGLPFAATDHPLLDPIAMVLTAYLAVETLSRRLGRDPDRPLMLSKVTETL